MSGGGLVRLVINNGAQLSVRKALSRYVHFEVRNLVYHNFLLKSRSYYVGLTLIKIISRKDARDAKINNL